METERPVVLVTGASRGIGRAITEDLAVNGFRVVATARSGDQLAGLERDFGRDTIVGLAVDMSDAAQVMDLPDEALTHFGRIDGLVNNAGASRFGDFAKLPLSAWTEAYALKMFGYVAAIQGLLPHFLEQASGAIVNIAGNGGKQVSPHHMIGGSINAALIHLTRSLAVEYGPAGIRVNAVSPGPIETERMASLFQEQADQQGLSAADARKKFVSDVPLGRLGQPSEVARLVRFLLSDESGYITGENILIDGGMVRGT